MNPVLLTPTNTDFFSTSADMIRFFTNDTDYFNTALINVIDTVVIFCGVFSGLFFLMRAAYAMYKGAVIDRRADWFDYKLLLQGCILLFALFTYSNSVVFLDNFLNKATIRFSDMFETSWDNDNAKAIYVTYLKKNQDRLDLTNDDLNTLVSSATGDAETNIGQLRAKKMADTEEQPDKYENSLLSDINRTLRDWTTVFFQYLILFAALLIKILVVCLIMGLSTFLLAIGPLAICCSLIPMWKDKWKEWLGTFVTVKCSAITLIILDYCMNAITASSRYSTYYATEMGGETDAMALLQLGLMAAFACCYFMVFWLTSRWIGDEDSGKAITWGMTTALAVMSGGAVKAVKALSGLGKGGKDPEPPSPIDSLSESKVS